MTISLNWWGADARIQSTLKAIDLFEKEHPNIHVKPMYSDWVGYWDRLATSTASGDMPDVNQFDQLYLAAYADRGALLDLASVDDFLDTSKLDPKALQSGRVDDTSYAVPVGTATNAILINTSLFEKYGVDLPDTDHWTWDDFERAAVELGKASHGKAYGVGPVGSDSFVVNVWARQHGGQLFDEQGDVAIDPDILAAYWRRILDFIDKGAAPPVSHIFETTDLPMDQGDMVQGRTGMGFIAAGQFTSYAAAAPTRTSCWRTGPPSRAASSGSST
ncbi:extracellular solute-binding protein [Streptomyces sp. M19]